MSKIALSGPAGGTATYTVTAPAGVTDRTLTLPDQTGTLTTAEAVVAAGYTTSAGVLTQFNAAGAAPVYACRAWVNFNGTGTVAIRASGNVTSITDNGTGNYTVNFTTAMPDANYSVISTIEADGTGFGQANIANGTTPTTSAVQMRTINNSVFIDPTRCFVAIFR